MGGSLDWNDADLDGTTTLSNQCQTLRRRERVLALGLGALSVQCYEQ